jgi:hypothetical protein
LVDRARHGVLVLLWGSPAIDPTSRTRYILMPRNFIDYVRNIDYAV